jgi:HEAT repeat protein
MKKASPSTSGIATTATQFLDIESRRPVRRAVRCFSILLLSSVSVSCGSPAGQPSPVGDQAARVIANPGPEASVSRESTQAERRPLLAAAPSTQLAGGNATQKPEKAVEIKQAGQGAPLDLEYRWKPGTPYVYSVQVSYDAGTSVVTLDGSSIYTVKSSDQDGSSLVHRGWLVRRINPAERAGGPRPEVHMPGSPTTTEIELDSKGDAQIAKESLPVPLLGDLAMLMIEPFPDGAVDRWELERKIALNEIHTSGGAAAPLRFGRPNVPGRAREPRLQANARARAGSRIGGRAARSPRSRTAPAPSAVQVNVITHPAQERRDYVLGPQSLETISISKKYELKTDEKVGNDPTLLMTGEGTLTFDIKRGVPVAFNFQAKVTHNSPNVTLRIPITVACRLLEGEERTKALRFPVIPETAMIPMDDAELRKALADLKTPEDTRRREAAGRLRDGRPIESRRAEVSEALTALIDQRDPSLKGAVIQALGVWGNSPVSDVLIDRLNDDRYGCRGELFEAIGRLEPNEKVVRALIGWFKRDAGQAGRSLRAFGPPAEPALLDFVAGKNDPQLRVEACRVLKDIGTGQSAPVLEKLVSQRAGEELGRAAAGAIRAITDRMISDTELAKVLSDMQGTDVGRVRDAIRRLERVNRIPARQAEVSKTLVRVLDTRDEDSQKMAIHVLANWGDAAAMKALAKKLEDPSFGAWREAIETLHASRAADGSTAGAVARWTGRDRGLVLRTLIDMGPAAEPALVAVARSQEDNSARVEACNALAAGGSPKCIPPLRELASNKTNESLARAAEDAIKRAQERSLTDAEWKPLLDDLKTGDEEKRRRAADRLARIDRFGAHQASVARALEALLVQTTERTQRDALRALSVWADSGSVQPLAERSSDRQFNPWREALDVIAKIDSSPRAIAIILGKMPDDPGHVSRLLHSMRAAVEPAVAEAIRTATDDRTRVESCRLLESIGTEASMPVLRPLAEQADLAEVARAAEDALRGIRERG